MSFYARTLCKECGKIVGVDHKSFKNGSPFQPFIYEDELVLEVECGSNIGWMYLSRLCQGSKGASIWFQDDWLTPNEFQFISGRETAKDWKRSIRHKGRSLKLLIAKGFFEFQPAICLCKRLIEKYVSTLGFCIEIE